MEVISAETVEKTCLKMWEMSEQDAYKLSYIMQQEQPWLVAYLAAADQNILNQEEQELLFYLGTVVWQIMTDGRKNVPQISEDSLLRIEQENLKMAETLQKANAVTFAKVIKNILKDYPQPEVFKYVVAALMEQDNEDNAVRDENLGIILMDLKTVIDCFNR